MSNSVRGKVLIGLRILFGLAFVAAGTLKLVGVPQMVAEFDVVGLGQWFRYVTGAIEIIGALLLIRSKTVLAGASLLLGISIGAFFAQFLKLHGDVIHTLVFAGAMAFVAFSYRNSWRRAT